MLNKIKCFIVFLIISTLVITVYITHKKEVIITFTTDNNYATFIPVTIESIKEFADPKRQYKIFIFATDISDEHTKIIQSMQSKNMMIQFIDIKDKVVEMGISSLNTRGHLNTAAYYRFFIPELLPNYKKAVYLEADQILQDDVAKLYDTDLQNKSLGVIPQMKYTGNTNKSFLAYQKDVLELDENNRYFNDGVLVLNLEKLRENNFRKQALFIAKNDSFRYMDQDILNFLFARDCFYIDEKWNLEVFILKERHEEIEPKLIHFTTRKKPWNSSKPDANSFMYSDLFWKYAKKTPNYQEILNFATK